MTRESLLNAVVKESPPLLDIIFTQIEKTEEEKGACVTYSKILSEVLGEFGIWAQVRPVLCITANRLAYDAMKGRITKQEAAKRGAKIQVWGDITEGQVFQHAVCYITEWDAVVDLAMATRGSMKVPSHPYWAKAGVQKSFPWWVASFEFKTYRLDDYGYRTYPEKVKLSKEVVRAIVRRELQ